MPIVTLKKRAKIPIGVMCFVKSGSSKKQKRNLTISCEFADWMYADCCLKRNTGEEDLAGNFFKFERI